MARCAAGRRAGEGGRGCAAGRWEGAGAASPRARGAMGVPRGLGGRAAALSRSRSSRTPRFGGVGRRGVADPRSGTREFRGFALGVMGSRWMAWVDVRAFTNGPEAPAAAPWPGGPIWWPSATPRQGPREAPELGRPGRGVRYSGPHGGGGCRRDGGAAQGVGAGGEPGHPPPPAAAASRAPPLSITAPPARRRRAPRAAAVAPPRRPRRRRRPPPRPPRAAGGAARRR
jgi:hypothetical protein